MTSAGLRQKPDFLCIGAGKSGTSWLHEGLARHPDFWSPPLKEPLYFDRDLTYFRQLTLRGWPYDEARRRLLAAIPRAVGGGGTGELFWYANYALRPRSDAWYRSLFKPAGDRLTGDFSPSYAFLTADRIARVAALLPEARIVYLLRNPVDRDWSGLLHRHLRNELPRDGWRATVQAGQFPDRFDRMNSDYLENLRRWGDCYPASQVFVGFFDDLVADPNAMMLRIVAFLGGGGGADRLPGGLDRAANPGPGIAMPGEIELMLSRLHLDRMRGLDARFPGAAPARWLARAMAVCEAAEA